MSQTKRRLNIIKSYIGWEDYLGFAILFVGILGFISGPIPYITGWTTAYYSIRAELIGIGVTVLIIDNANEAVKRREEKKRLILQMGSPDNAFAVEAVRQLTERGWLIDGSLNGARLMKADLNDANLFRAELINADLRLAKLQKANLWLANLYETMLGNADIRGADLNEANLYKADLRRANLQGANLRESNMKKAILRSADLANADLRHANLQGADLRGAILGVVIMWDFGQDGDEPIMADLADFREANLREANLDGAIGKIYQLEEARSLEGAIMPDGSKHP